MAAVRSRRPGRLAYKFWAGRLALCVRGCDLEASSVARGPGCRRPGRLLSALLSTRRGLPAPQFERVPTRVVLEQQANDLFVELITFVADRRTVLRLLDLGRTQGLSDPPLNLVTLLAHGTVRTSTTELECTVVVTVNLVRPVQPALEPPDLSVAQFNPRRTLLADGCHQITVASAHRLATP